MMHTFQTYYCVLSVLSVNSMMAYASLLSSGMKEQGASEDYCQYEAFNARCLTNEVILVTSATYGRMSIGRCITAEEVAAHRSVAGDDPRYFGCSSDVLPFFDRKCSGKAECEIRVIAMSLKNVTPCFPGLILYLEVSYTCISVLDEERSCAVTASTNPVHIISTSAPKRICGSKSNPWIINASVGRRINISLLDFAYSNRDAQEKRPCHVIGQIVDRVGKRNGSICVGSSTREKSLFLSVGNTVNIYVDSSELEKSKENDANENQFLLKIQALGCSDIVPPDDAWLKRDGDEIVIGCYSIRQNWLLKCKGDKWTGVLGNCSHGVEQQSKTESEAKPTTSSDEEVVAIVAIAGLTLAFCLAITCTGAVCLRRFYSKSKMKQEYNNTLLSIRSQHNIGQRIPSALCTHVVGSDANQMSFQDGPTYSVFAEDFSETKDADNSVIAYTGSQSCSAQV